MSQIREDRAVFECLNASTILANLINDPDQGVKKIYPIIAPPGDVFPCIVYRLASSDPIITKDGQLEDGNFVMEVIVLAHGNNEAGYTTLRDIRDEVVKMFAAADDNVYGVTKLENAFVIGERDEVYDLEAYIIGRVITVKMMLAKVAEE